jgi:hypothetical protein
VLHGYAQLSGAVEDGGGVEGEGLAAQDEAAGGVAEDADVRILDGAQDAFGRLFAGLFEVGVNAGDDDVHLREDIVGKIERAVFEDVYLDAGEDADAAFEFLLDFADAADVLEGALDRRGRWSWRGSWSGR